jgi:hypothetical protein
MAKRQLSSFAADATLSDVVEGLDKPVEYVRRILEKLERCRRAHGDAQVRFALKSRPECPNYLIEYAATNPKTQKVTIHADAAYSGSTHRELAPRHIEDVEAWSPEELNIDAVSALIGRLRTANA